MDKQKNISINRGRFNSENTIVKTTLAEDLVADCRSQLKFTDPLIDLQLLHEFAYLSSLPSSTGNSKQEIKKKIAVECATMYRLKQVLSDRRTARQTEIRLAQTVVFSVFSCGCEAWTREDQRIDAFEL